MPEKRMEEQKNTTMNADTIAEENTYSCDYVIVPRDKIVLTEENEKCGYGVEKDITELALSIRMCGLGSPLNAAPQEFETDEFYSYYFCKTFTEPATSETPEKVKLVTAKVVNIMKETGKIYVVDLPAPMEKAADTADTLLFNSKLKVNEEGYVKECNSYSVMVSNDDCYNLDIADVCFAKKYWVCDKGYVIKNDEYLVVTNLCGETLYEIKDPTAVKELSSFYTLIDVKQEREKTAFLFGNDDFFAKKCVVEKTYDRGDIVTVEDYTVE